MMFQYINYLYLGLFTAKKWSGLDTIEERVALLEANIKEYGQINFIGTILSVSYYLSFICRLIFNYNSKNKIPMDIWMLFDLVCATVNIAAFNYIGIQTA